VAIEIDFANKARRAALERARKQIVAGYRILRDDVGADNPSDNAFLREARICAVAKIIWTGERGGADGRTKGGDEVEIKSTRLDLRSTISFPTSRYVSQTVIVRFRKAKFWLFGVFDVYEELIAVYRVEAKDMAPLIKVLDQRRRARERQGRASENNPKFTLSGIRPRAKCLFMHAGYKDEEVVPGRWTIRRR
jgi:hypothetical protein